MREVSRNRGFTFAELLLVLGIVTVLIALALPLLARSREDARLTRCLGEMRQLSTIVLLYTDGAAGHWPLAWQRHPAGGWVAPNGMPLEGSYFTVAGSFWALPMLDDEFQGTVYHETLLCPNDRKTLSDREFVAGQLGVDADGVTLRIVREISAAMYVSPRALAEDRTPWRDEFAKVTRLSDVTFPSQKALLVEGEFFHESEPGQPDAARRGGRFSVSAADGSVRWRAVADANPAVLFDLELPPWPDGERRLRDALAFLYTHNGVHGRDW